jgi:flavin reductase (DIM6/NTAB) family NADH-FMN oxidoreductase RutF
VLANKLKDAHYNFGFEPIRVRFTPTTAVLKECIQAGKEFTQKLQKTKRLRTPRQAVTEIQIDRTEQAVGRIVGSLCVLTTHTDNVHRGVLTSWVSQATFNPPGIMIAIPQEQNGEHDDLISNPGDKFVLNILNEGRTVRRNFDERPPKGFDNSYNGDKPRNGLSHRVAERRFPSASGGKGTHEFEEQSSDSFGNLTTKPANNGCLIIEDALAYIECTVQSYLETGDRTLIYAVAEQGEILESNGITAIQHRKSGSHY